MFKSMLDGIRGVFSILLYTVNTVVCCTAIFIVALFKLLLPVKPIQTGCRKILTAIANCWIGVNNLNQRLFNGIHWDVQGLDNLDPKGWYMVVANHQSWVDILVLQNVFYRKIPFLKFFLKKELFWFPLLGQAWWALDFPFMKRYSRQFLKKHPHLIGKDLEDLHLILSIEASLVADQFQCTDKGLARVFNIGVKQNQRHFCAELGDGALV